MLVQFEIIGITIGFISAIVLTMPELLHRIFACICCKYRQKKK